MDIAAVILAYAGEALLVTLIVDIDEDAWDTFRAKFALVGLCVAAASVALNEMSWDPSALVGICAFVVSGAVSAWWSARERQLRFREVYASPRSYFWRVAIVGMGLVGLIAGRDYEELVDHSWTPAPTDGLISELSMLPVRAAVALDVTPMVIPAVMLVVFKAVNEILYEVFTILEDEEPDGPAPYAGKGRHARGS
jgi:hypothetical protein